ncbi:hypothetical protein BUH_4309 [Burkholderia pseudomallei Pakistan 9]|nr:hypothetical protein BUH_4309 [Burkholderia pseudomallei Pakistan 9]
MASIVEHSLLATPARSAVLFIGYLIEMILGLLMQIRQ